MSLTNEKYPRCASCHDKQATMLVTWQSFLPSGVVHRAQQLQVCGSCEPAARSYCTSSKHSPQTVSLPSGVMPLKHSWIAETFRSPASEVAVSKCRAYPELLGLVTIPEPSNKALLTSDNASWMTSPNSYIFTIS